MLGIVFHESLSTEPKRVSESKMLLQVNQTEWKQKLLGET